MATKEACSIRGCIRFALGETGSVAYEAFLSVRALFNNLGELRAGIIWTSNDDGRSRDTRFVKE